MEQSISIERANAEFLARCEALNLARGTVGWYRGVLGAMARSLANQGVNTLAHVRAPHLREHLSALKRSGHAAETVFRSFGALRCAFRFWTREAIIASNPMLLVERPRRERVLIQPLNPEQAARLLAAPDMATRRGARDLAMMMLMLDSGLRISEALDLEVGRIDWNAGTFTVMGKGRRERSVPFSIETGRVLRACARARQDGPVRSPQLLLGKTGRPLERGRARKLIVRYGRKAGIEGVRLSPHTLRHTFAVLYIRAGGDPFSLQEILGHSTLEMTRRYVHLARRDIVEQHQKFAPMAGLLKRVSVDRVLRP